MTVKNGKIISTFLGVEDHGCFTFMLTLDYGGVCQGFGGYDLKWREYGAAALRGVLEVVGVEKWEDLKGKHVRADAEHTKITRLGHIIEDKWISMGENGLHIGPAAHDLRDAE